MSGEEGRFRQGIVLPLARHITGVIPAKAGTQCDPSAFTGAAASH
jgi:hypothetical protein